MLASTRSINMHDNPDKPRSQADTALEREIRKERKFSLSEAIGRLAGPGAMKGESPVTRHRQAEAEIGEYLARHLDDSPGALRTVLLRQFCGSDLLLNNLEQPLIVLAACIKRTLDSDYRLKELVREADVEWGRATGERPHFETEGSAPHPEDPYTVESVRKTLLQFLEAISC
jgi:hypothetical protein